MCVKKKTEKKGVASIKRTSPSKVFALRKVSVLQLGQLFGVEIHNVRIHQQTAIVENTTASMSLYVCTIMITNTGKHKYKF